MTLGRLTFLLVDGGNAHYKSVGQESSSPSGVMVQ